MRTADGQRVEGVAEISWGVHHDPMDISEWWPRLDDSTRQWLIDHNGEALSADALGAISAAGGVVTSDAWWVGQGGPTGFYLSDAAVDWIEERANDE